MGQKYHKITMLIITVFICVSLSACTPGERPSVSPAATDESSVTPGAPSAPTHDPAVTPSIDPEIHFKDVNLENVVREHLNKNIGPIFVSDVREIKVLSARVRGILNIEDLVFFSGLEELDLYGNRISDLRPLSKLINLKSLTISANYSPLYASGSSGLDLTPLKSLSKLETLRADSNFITDISPLSHLTSLKVLSLSKNRISDVAALKSLTLLVHLNLSANIGTQADTPGISDISCISDMKHLEYLDVSDNIIVSLEAAALLENLKTVLANGNLISDISYFAGNHSIVYLNCEYNLIPVFDVILEMRGLQTVLYHGNFIVDYEAIDAFYASRPDPYANNLFTNFTK